MMAYAAVWVDKVSTLELLAAIQKVRTVFNLFQRLGSDRLLFD